jgi:hypothetical protein
MPSSALTHGYIASLTIGLESDGGIKTDDGKYPKNVDRYIELGQQQYANKGDRSWWPTINALTVGMQNGDLCWTRISGVYYLGRIIGAWRYLHGQDADDHDVHNIRPCTWARVGLIDAVPGAVERAFMRSRTLQRVKDTATIAYSNYLYAVLTEQQSMPLPTGLDIFGLFSPLEHEDIAALYLQIERGYAVMPSSAKTSTAAYECIFVHRETGKKAVLQMKSGETSLNIMSFETLPARVFVVVADGAVYGSVPANVEIISRSDLLGFAQKRRDIMPDRVQRFMQWAGL